MKYKGCFTLSYSKFHSALTSLFYTCSDLEKSFNQPPPLDFYLTLVDLSMHPGTTCKLQDVDSSAVSVFMVRRNALLAPGEEFVMGQTMHCAVRGVKFNKAME